MKAIKNPFVNLEGYNCFGCSPNNPIGLSLEFWYNEKDKTVLSQWEPNKNLMGYNDILHGGIQATLLDEIASWVVYAVVGTGGFTAQMQIRYRKPVNINDGTISLKAWLIKHEKRLAHIGAELHNGKGELSAEGTLKYFVYPKDEAKKNLGYPGIESFI